MEEDLLRHKSKTNMNRDVMDFQVWGNEDTEVFSVKSAYECLENHARGTHNNFFQMLMEGKSVT